MKTKLLTLIAPLLCFGLLACSDQKTVDPSGNQNKSTCKSVSSDGIAKLLNFDKTGVESWKTRVTFSWAVADGTVYDTTEYNWVVTDQCLVDENLALGSMIPIHIYVQCPKAPSKANSIRPMATAPVGFYFPSLKSASCQ